MNDGGPGRAVPYLGTHETPMKPLLGPCGARRLRLAITIALQLLVVQAAGRTQEASVLPAQRERLQITAVAVPVRVTRKEGAEGPPPLESIVVREGGELRTVLSLEPMLAPEPGEGAEPSGGPEPALPSDSLPSPIQQAPQPATIYIYVDVPMAGRAVVDAAVRRLDLWMKDFCSIGRVSLVVADPGAVEVVPPTRVVKRLRSAVRDLPLRASARGRIERFRTEVLRSSADLGRSAPLIRSLAAQEAAILLERRKELVLWAAKQQGRTGPKLLLLVSGAYDSDPTEFYLDRYRAGVDRMSERAALEADLARLSQGQSEAEFARDLAALGWMVFPMVPADTGFSEFGSAAVGGSAVWQAMARGALGGGSPPPAFLFTHPLSGWSTAARTTGGEVLASDAALRSFVRGAEDLYILAYQRTGVPSGRVFRLGVSTSDPRFEMAAPQWTAEGTPEGLAALRALEVAESGETSGDLHYEVDAVEVVEDPDPSSEGGAILRARISISGIPEGVKFGEAWRAAAVIVEKSGRVQVRAHAASGRHPLLNLTLRIPETTERVGLFFEDLETGMWGSVQIPVPRSSN